MKNKSWIKFQIEITSWRKHVYVMLCYVMLCYVMLCIC